MTRVAAGSKPGVLSTIMETVKLHHKGLEITTLDTKCKQLSRVTRAVYVDRFSIIANKYQDKYQEEHLCSGISFLLELMCLISNDSHYRL